MLNFKEYVNMLTYLLFCVINTDYAAKHRNYE